MLPTLPRPPGFGTIAGGVASDEQRESRSSRVSFRNEGSPSKMAAPLPPHVIRLRGPWVYQPLERQVLAGDGSVVAVAGGLPEAGRITLPDDWGKTLGGDFRGRVRYVRRFGRPSNLDRAQRVWLVCDGVDLRATCELNARALGPIEGYRRAVRFDITSELAERNELTVDVELPPLDYQSEQGLRPDRAGLPGGIIGEVRLEIEPAAGDHA